TSSTAKMDTRTARVRRKIKMSLATVLLVVPILRAGPGDVNDGKGRSGRIEFDAQQGRRQNELWRAVPRRLAQRAWTSRAHRSRHLSFTHSRRTSTVPTRRDVACASEPPWLSGKPRLEHPAAGNSSGTHACGAPPAAWGPASPPAVVSS